MAVFLYLSKAFDMVDHQLLFKKVEYFYRKCVRLKLLSNHPSGKQQYVDFQNIDADQMFIKHGVPQGSILGALFFLIFINNLHNVPSVLSYISFADDSNLLISGSNFKQLLKTMNDELEKAYMVVQK